MVMGLSACSDQPDEDPRNVGDPNRWVQGEPQEKLDAMLEEALAKLPEDPLRYDADGLALPPWEAFPEYSRYTLGWRMGGGEDYWMGFGRWFTKLSLQQQAEYQSKYPSPEGWEDFYGIMARL